MLSFTSFNVPEKDIIEADIFIDAKIIHSGPMSTISEFSMDNGAVTGFFMEREAGTEGEERTAESKKRIPPGVYTFVKNDCNLYRRKPRHLRRDYCGIEFRLSTKSQYNGITRDGVLIHIGNYTSNTSGCLLPGSSYELNKDKTKVKMNRKTREYFEDARRIDCVWGSKPKLNEMMEHVNRRIAETKASGKDEIIMKIRLR